MIRLTRLQFVATLSLGERVTGPCEEKVTRRDTGIARQTFPSRSFSSPRLGLSAQVHSCVRDITRWRSIDWSLICCLRKSTVHDPNRC
jgi:hypothetical protein